MVEIQLPFPPSVNEMYANCKSKGRKGRILTAEYVSWKKEAGWVLTLQRPPQIKGRVIVTIDLDERRAGDCDNRSKPLLDLLVTHGVISGDSKNHVKRVSIGWEKVSGCRMTLEAA